MRKFLPTKSSLNRVSATAFVQVIARVCFLLALNLIVANAVIGIMIHINRITLAEAAKRAGVEQKKLLGRALRNDFDDPMIVDKNENGEPLLLDDWRLKKFEKSVTV